MTGVVAAALLFGGMGGGWLLLVPNAEPVRFSTVAGLAPVELAVSSDARRWAVVTHTQEGSSLALVEADQVKRTVSLPGLRMMDPRFSRDGAAVTFSARSTSEVPHAVSMNYAQLWRVGFARGEPKKLTDTRGCHELPHPLADGRTLFVHATCAGGRALEWLTGGKELRPVPDLGEVREVAATADGQRIVFSRLAPFGLEVLELQLPKGTPRKLGLVQVDGPRHRLAWDFDEKNVLVQDRGAVYRLGVDGTLTEVARVAGGAR